MTYSPFRRAIPPAILSFFLILPGIRAFPGDEILKEVRSALLDPRGHELRIQWDYFSRAKNWSSEGILQILGEDFMKLAFPDFKILIKHSTIMAWYRETDQVIIDSFNRGDPTNVFSLFLSGFDAFDAGEATALSDTTAKLILRGSQFEPFQNISLVVDTRNWMPLSIDVEAGEGEKVAVRVIEMSALSDSDALMNDTLSGSSSVDLRQ